MMEFQSQLQSDPTNVQLIAAADRSKKEYAKAADTELKLLKKKAKIRWLHGMDQNSMYFHSVVKERNAQHNIVRLKREDGTYAVTYPQIAEEVIKFYEGLVGRANDNLLPIDSQVLAVENGHPT